MANKNSDIFCIEDNWKRNAHGFSAEPFLNALQWYHGEMKFKLRTADTKADLLNHVEDWATGDWNYGILYFWYHGVPNAILPGDDQVVLEEIGEIVGGQCEGTSLIHLGTCSTLRLTDDAFFKTTGAAALSGYRVDVDWIHSVAFELLYMKCVQDVMFRMSDKRPKDDLYLYPDVMQEVWRLLNEDPKTRSLLDHLQFNMRIATSNES